ncbi:MAG TPA: alpha-amylase family protein [Polyangiaceae bacterium]|nr:alpha-amylase family protein [Polyangiaceae bacterium]
MTPRVRLLFCVCVVLLGCSRGSSQPGDPDENPSTAGATSSGATSSGATSSGAAAGATTGGGGAAAQAGTTGASSGTNAGGAGGAAAQAGNGNAGGSGAGASSMAPLPNDTASGVFVHLFEWRWPDVARECENFLGPHGFTAVQVSPPSEHAVLSGFPWWQRYQTVGYQLESRSGTRAEFIDMVSRCRAVGVGIYVDAVLNHMTAQASGTGSGGTKFTKYAYPNLFTQTDFHTPVCQIMDSDYALSAEHVQRCELVGLADLDTGSATVQAKLAGYLSDLLAIGVRGFRLDASKHMAPPDLKAILSQVVPRAGEKPYYFLEVIDYGGEAVHATDYLDVGGAAELDVTEFKFKGVGDIFLGRNNSSIAALKNVSEQSWSLLASDRAVTFINNHDTQRADADFYQDGPAHDLATVFMLAWPYGYPSVMSSYGFNRGTAAGRDIGPPSDGGGTTRPVYAAGANEPSCVAGPYTPTTQGYICEHRARYVAGMVGFRKATAGALVGNVWDNGANQLAFSRGDRGFVAINHEAAALSQALPTGLAAGKYCDVLSGDFVPAAGASNASCGGTVVEVDASGKATLTIAPESAIAIHVNARL